MVGIRTTQDGLREEQPNSYSPGCHTEEGVTEESETIFVTRLGQDGVELNTETIA